MLGKAGTYYIKISEYSKRQDDECTISYKLIDPDAYEYNNNYKSATQLGCNIPIEVTLPADNDKDWFSIGKLTAGDHISVSIVNNGQSAVEIGRSYFDEQYNDISDQGNEYISKSSSKNISWTVEDDAEYYLYLKPWSSVYYSDVPVKLRYTITRDDVPVTGVSITNGNATIFEGGSLQLYADMKPYNATNQSVTWTSSNDAVATVDENGNVKGIAPGSTVITAKTADGGYTASTTITVVKSIPVNGMTIKLRDGVNPDNNSQSEPKVLAYGSSLYMSASVQPENASNRNIVWSVTDENVLNVTDNGKVYAVGSGTAAVKATSEDGNYSAEFWFNVPDESYPVKGVSINMNAATIYMGEEGIQLSASVFPSYANNKDVVWSSEDESIAKVDQNGHVMPVSEGYTTVKVTTAENAFTASCEIAVRPVRTRVESIHFENTEINVGLYGTVELMPVITPADATDKSITWTTSNKTVATVSRNGVVTALNLGVAEITAVTNDGSFSAKVKITVSSGAENGDVNNDGVIDSADAMMVLRSSVGLIAMSQAQKAVADVNGDGSIDAGDAILILRYDAGLIDSFPEKK